jgi:hypothetical protein
MKKIKVITKSQSYIMPLAGLGVLAAVVIILAISGRLPGAPGNELNPPANEGNFGMNIIADVSATPDAAELKPAAVNYPPLKFAVISDTHIKEVVGLPRDITYSEYPGYNLERIGKALWNAKLDFVMDTGDNVADLYDSPAKGDIPAVFETYGKWIHENFNPKTPYYLAMGNHDNRMCVVSGLGCKFKYFAATAEAAWNKFISKGNYKPLSYPTGLVSDSANTDYYSWKQNGFNLIVLNTAAETSATKDGKVSFGETQLTWLSDLLNDEVNNPEPVILFWHSDQLPSMVEDAVCQIYQNPGDTKLRLDPRCTSEILKILYEHMDKVRAVFMGHAHSFHKFAWGNVMFYRTTTATCNKEEWIFDGESEVPVYDGLPDYDVFYKVTADATGVDKNGIKGKVTIENEANIFKFAKDGETPWTSGKKYPPAKCEIPGDINL